MKGHCQVWNAQSKRETDVELGPSIRVSLCAGRDVAFLELLPFLQRVLHLASVAAVVGADDAVLGHPVDHPRRAAVADAEGALQQGDAAAAFADDDLDGLL